MRNESLPPESLPLTEASVQEIQLELIRRRRFNQFDGPKIVRSLRNNRKLWTAVLMDNLGFTREQSQTLSGLSLIKLRDLHTNNWNVDTMYILCDDRADGQRLVEIAEQDGWLADTQEVYADSEVGFALGTSEPACIVELWWD